MREQLVQLTVRGVALEHETETPIILLGELSGSRTVHVPVGPFEASAIIIEMEGMRPPRPLTHDLVALLFRTHGLTLERLELFAAVEDGYLARLRYRGLLRRWTVEVRPSDGIAIALRLTAPIFATEDVMVSKPFGPTLLERASEDGEILFLGADSGDIPIV